MWNLGDPELLRVQPLCGTLVRRLGWGRSLGMDVDTCDHCI